MHKTAAVAIAALLAAGLSQPASAQDQQATKGTIRIGCITPLSGAAAPIGNNLSAGARFAVAQRPVVNGWKIELDTQDTVGDPTIALRKSQELAGNSEVRAITCIGYSQEANAIAGALKTGRLAIPFVDGNNASNSVTGEHCNPWTFRLAPNIAAMVNTAQNYLKNHPDVVKTGIYIIGSDSAYGNGMADALKATDLKILGSNLAALDTTDWVPVINKALSSGADAIWLPVNFGTPLAQFLKQASELGLFKQAKVFLPLGLPFLDAIQNLGEAGVGLFSTSLPNDFTLPEAAGIAEAYFQANGSAPSQQTLQQVAVTNIILDAIAAVDDPTRENIREALKNGEFRNFTGTVKFRQPDQQAIQSLFEGSIQKLDTPRFGASYSWVVSKRISSADVLPSPAELGCKL